MSQVESVVVSWCARYLWEIVDSEGIGRFCASIPDESGLASEVKSYAVSGLSEYLGTMNYEPYTSSTQYAVLQYGSEGMHG